MNLDTILDWAVLSVSIFNTITFFWLGAMVLFTGDRRAAGTWLTGSGLLLGALFFTSHTAIMGLGIDRISLGMDFWWWVSWSPALAAPLVWYGAMLWYAGYRLKEPHPHHLALISTISLAVVTALLLILANPLPSYANVAGWQLIKTPTIAGVPLMFLAYIAYLLACYLLPLDLLRRPAPQPENLLSLDARRRARPWLVAASIFLLLSGVIMAWTAFWALRADQPLMLSNLTTARAVKQYDLIVEILIGLVAVLLGRAIVAYEVFTGRPLPRTGFFRQWRSTVTLAAVYGVVVAGMLTTQLRPLYSLMLATVLMTFFYTLYHWRTFIEREQFLARLRPFISSQNLYAQMVSAAPPDPGAPFDMFETLCRDVLGSCGAILFPLGAVAALTGEPLCYPAGNTKIMVPNASELTECLQGDNVNCQPATQWNAGWAVPLRNQDGLAGALLLDEKHNGNPYTEEEIEIARAGGERLLDMLAGTMMARMAMALLRQRLTEARIAEGQGRRILHDDILPQLHAAILSLSGHPDDPAVAEAVESLSSAHRQISDWLREMPIAAPQRLARVGLAAALRDLLKDEFLGAFENIEWQIEPNQEALLLQLPNVTSEVVYFAARELIRNAANHAGDPTQQLQIAVETIPAGLSLSIGNSGGMPTPPSNQGSGSGLRIHSAMLAAVGAHLEIRHLSSGGRRAVIHISTDNH